MKDSDIMELMVKIAYLYFELCNKGETDLAVRISKLVNEGIRKAHPDRENYPNTYRHLD